MARGFTLRNSKYDRLVSQVSSKSTRSDRCRRRGTHSARLRSRSLLGHRNNCGIPWHFQTRHHVSASSTANWNRAWRCKFRLLRLQWPPQPQRSLLRTCQLLRIMKSYCTPQQHFKRFVTSESRGNLSIADLFFVRFGNRHLKADTFTAQRMGEGQALGVL